MMAPLILKLYISVTAQAYGKLMFFFLAGCDVIQPVKGWDLRAQKPDDLIIFEYFIVFVFWYVNKWYAISTEQYPYNTRINIYSSTVLFISLDDDKWYAIVTILMVSVLLVPIC